MLYRPSTGSTVGWELTKMSPIAPRAAPTVVAAQAAPATGTIVRITESAAIGTRHPRPIRTSFVRRNVSKPRISHSTA